MYGLRTMYGGGEMWYSWLYDMVLDLEWSSQNMEVREYLAGGVWIASVLRPYYGGILLTVRNPFSTYSRGDRLLSLSSGVHREDVIWQICVRHQGGAGFSRCTTMALTRRLIYHRNWSWKIWKQSQSCVMLIYSPKKMSIPFIIFYTFDVFNGLFTPYITPSNIDFRNADLISRVDWHDC